jgi:hypothetical protein
MVGFLVTISEILTAKGRRNLAIMSSGLRFLFRSILVLLTTAFVLTGTARRAEAESPVLVGNLTTVQVPCPTLCTQGVMTGGLPGQLDFVMGTMTPTGDPDVFLYTGTNTITTATGTLAGTDHGVWNVATGEFVDFMVFSTQTGAYSGKHGSFTITGVFDPVAGQGHSKYVAVLWP